MAKPILTKSELDSARMLRTLYESRKKDLGLTQQKVAEQLGISQATVAQYLTGVIPLNLTKLLQFAEILDIAPSAISKDLTKTVNIKTLKETSHVPVWGYLNGLHSQQRTIVIRGLKMAKNVLAIMVNDQDMAPILPEGSAIIINPVHTVTQGDNVLVKFVEMTRWMPLKVQEITETSVTLERMFSDKCMDKYLQYQSKKGRKFPMSAISNLFKITSIQMPS